MPEHKNVVIKMNFVECLKFHKLAIVAIIFGSMFAFSSCGDTKVKYLSRGEELLKQRKFHEAKMEFRAAADYDKNSADAYWGMARADESLGQMYDTIENLRQSVALDSNNLDAKSKLGNYFLLLDPPQFWEVDKLLAEIFTANPNFVEGHILKASLMTLQNKPESDILKTLQFAISLDPNRVESYLSLSRYYQRVGNPAESEKIIQKAITVAPKSALGFMEYGRFMTFAKRANEAEAQYKLGILVDPTGFDAREALASFYLSNRDLDKAEQTYKELVSIEQNNPESRVMLAEFYAVVGRDDDAIKTFDEILLDNSGLVKARYRLGEIYLQKKNLAKANEQVDTLLSMNDTDAEALILRSRIKLQQNETEAAVKDLEEVLKKQPTFKFGLFYMAQAKLSLGQADQARAFITDLEKYHPNYLFSKVLKIQASFIGNEPAKVVTQANELLDTVNASFPSAETSAQNLEDLRVRAITSRGLANIDLGKITEAKTDLLEVNRLSPKSANASMNLARVSIAEKNFGEAQSLFEKALTIEPKNFDALNGLINAYSRQQKFAEAHTKLDQQIAQNSDDKKLIPAFYFLNAEVFTAQKNSVSAEAELQKAIQLDETYLPAYSALAAILVSQKKADEAIGQYQAIVAKKPDSTIYTLIGMLEDSRLNHTESEKNYREALKVNPDNAIAINNLSWNIAENGTGNLDEALTMMQSLVMKDSGNAAYFDTLGSVYLKKNLFTPAVESLKKAIALDTAASGKSGSQPNQAYRVRLGSAFAGLGDKVNARRELEIALKNEKVLSKEDLSAAKGLIGSL
jgi:tetratricopeptide (TPR) repeat protein